MIIVSPNGGFGNRIRVMCSAFHYAELHNIPIQHLWDGGSYDCYYPHIQRVQDRGFSYFFQNVASVYTPDHSVEPPICYSEWLPSNIDWWWQTQNYGQTKLKCREIQPCSNLPDSPTVPFLIETTMRIMPMTALESHTIYKDYFKPQDNFTRQLSTLPTDTIGISIRRSEFLKFFPSANVSTEALHRWLQNFTHPVVLFSEDREFLAEARKMLKHLVHCPFEESVSVPEEKAFLEFLTLSRCQHVYGTCSSSFAEEAALFGNVPYTPINSALLL